MIFCTRCGSENHRAGDCSAPDQHLSPPLVPTAEAVAVVPVAEEANAVDPVFWKPRWPGGPSICSKENRGAFGCQADVTSYVGRWCGPSVSIVRIWKCDACGQFHFDAKGEWNRDSKLPRTPFIPFRRKPCRESAFGHVEMDLPKRELTTEQPKQKPVAVPRPQPKQERKAGMLF